MSKLAQATAPSAGRHARCRWRSWVTTRDSAECGVTSRYFADQAVELLVDESG